MHVWQLHCGWSGCTKIINCNSSFSVKILNIGEKCEKCENSRTLVLVSIHFHFCVLGNSFVFISKLSEMLSLQNGLALRLNYTFHAEAITNQGGYSFQKEENDASSKSHLRSYKSASNESLPATFFIVFFIAIQLWLYCDWGEKKTLYEGGKACLMRINNNCMFRNVLVSSGSKLFFSWLYFGVPLGGKKNKTTKTSKTQHPYLAFSLRNDSNQKSRFIISCPVAMGKNNPSREKAFSYYGRAVLGVSLCHWEREWTCLVCLGSTEKSGWC